MRAGDLRNDLTLQRHVQVGVDGHNSPIMVWQDWRTVACKVDVRRGKEHFDVKSQRRYSEDVWRFHTRYDDVAGISATMRIQHEGLSFDIKALLPEGQFRTDFIIEATVQGATIGAEAVEGYIDEEIPTGAEGQSYGGFTVKARGGTAPYVFSIVAGALPAGLALNSNTGQVDGTPSGAGTVAVTFRVEDTDGGAHDLPSINVTVL